MKKQIRLTLLALGFITTGLMNAQQTTGDITKKNNASLGSTDTSVRVIDNKGTIKYLQVDNGLTSFTNNTPSGGVVTTWQLGGSLATNTYIDVDGNTFALDGLTLATSTAVAATAATNNSSHSASNNPGYTVLIRDEQTGEIKKIMLTDLLNVESEVIDLTVGGTAASPSVAVASSTITDATAGQALSFTTRISKINVYRNGAKLRALVDYRIATVGTSQVVYLVLDTTNPDTNPNYWTLYDGDIIEIHAFK